MKKGKPEAPEKPKSAYAPSAMEAADRTWFTQKQNAKPFKPAPIKAPEQMVQVGAGLVTVNTMNNCTVVRLESKVDKDGRKDNTQTLRKLEKALGMNLKKKKNEPKDYISEMLLDDLKKTNAGRGN